MNTNSQRTAYGETLAQLGHEDPRVCVLDADLGKSTMGCLFEAAHPERYFQMGIAEANMMSVAAGLALTGKVPFASSFAVFASGRAYDQLRQTISTARLNVKVCGSSAGLSDFGDGATHQAVEDIALMRAIPNMTVLSPADACECAEMVRWMAANDGPMYLRVNRNDLPPVTGVTGAPFDPSKPVVLREGGDAVVFATGIMVSRALEAAETLMEKGISTRVVNVSVIKPLNERAIRDLSDGVRAIVTAEEHSVVGGLGAAVLSALADTGRRVALLGIDDRFGTSALDYDQLLKHYGLTAHRVAELVERQWRQWNGGNDA